MRNIVLKLKV